MKRTPSLPAAAMKQLNTQRQPTITGGKLSTDSLLEEGDNVRPYLSLECCHVLIVTGAISLTHAYPAKQLIA